MALAKSKVELGKALIRAAEKAKKEKEKREVKSKDGKESKDK